MKKLILLIMILMSVQSCTDEDLIRSAYIGGMLVYVGTMDKSDTLNYDGDVYYRTISCNSRYSYYDVSGVEYYSRNCIIRESKNYVTFGIEDLLTSILIYRR